MDDEERELADARKCDSLAKRLTWLLLSRTDRKARFPSLEKTTGIPKETWRSWWTKQTAPSGPLLEAACKKWPEHCIWLMTGAEDLAYGHVAPRYDGEIAPDGLKNVWIDTQCTSKLLQRLIAIHDDGSTQESEKGRLADLWSMRKAEIETLRRHVDF